MAADTERAAIGVFDSGLGGLTVLAALQKVLPDESFVYLGDTARVPYGTKSADSVTRYALQVVARLQNENIRMLVVACNTASALALPAIRAAFPDLPVIGVVEPGARRAVATTRNGRIGVIATEGTIGRGAYTRAIHALLPDAQVRGTACSLFVAMVEDGWVSGPLVEAIVAEYLRDFLEAPPESRADTLVLGCTHFPVLKPVIRNVLGPGVELIDSADTTAEAVRSLVQSDAGVARSGVGPAITRLCVTDGPERFARVAGIFLGRTVRPGEVELIDV